MRGEHHAGESGKERDESFTRSYVAVIVIEAPVRLDIRRSGDTVGQQHNTSSERTTLLKAMGVARRLWPW